LKQGNLYWCWNQSEFSAELQQLKMKQEGQLNRLNQLELLRNQLLLAVRTQRQQNQAQELEKLAQVNQARAQSGSVGKCLSSPKRGETSPG
jgi:hemolysin D